MQHADSQPTTRESIAQVADETPLLPMSLPETVIEIAAEARASHRRPSVTVAAGSGGYASEPAVVATSQSNEAVIAMAALAAVLEVWPADEPGTWLVDPRAITVDPMNARAGAPFAAEKRIDLIQSMGLHGNTVPVKLRRTLEGSSGFRCLSGSQRLGAALEIQKTQPAFRLRAVIYEDLSDREAFAMGEADNAGRTDVSAMDQARHWGARLDTIYAGDRKALIAATGKSASVVSRTLALLALPGYILDCCCDPEALNPHFAEQIVPRLADPAEEQAIRRRAQTLGLAGRKLPGPRLIKALLNDAPAANCATTPLWSSPDGSVSMTYRSSAKGGRVDFSGTIRAADRTEIRRALNDLIDRLGRTK